MKLSKEELIQLLKRQRNLELSAVKSISELADMSRNDVVKLLLIGVMQDSRKHAQILDALINLTESPTFGSVEKYEIGQGIDKHLKIEEEMLKETNEIIEKADDKEIRAILSQIASEEKRHHQTLVELKDVIQNIKKVSDDDVWDYLNRWANFSS